PPPETYTLSLHDALPILGDLPLRDDEGEDRLRSQLLERGEPVTAVRRPESVGLADRDDRIQVAPRLVHRARELEDMRVGDVPLRSEEHTSELQSPYELVW